MMDSLAVVHGKKGGVRDRIGRFTPLVAPHGQYPTRDGQWVALACNTDRQFQAFVERMGRPELASDERFRTAASRVTHHDVLNRLVEKVTAERTLAEILAALDELEVPGSPVNSIADIFRDAHVWERGNLVRMDDPLLGEVTMGSRRTSSGSSRPRA